MGGKPAGRGPYHVGFAGFCVGSSLALIAAEDPRINQQVALVNAFGGYYDLVHLLRATAAHSARYQNREYLWQPDRQTVALFAQNLLLFVDDPADRAALARHFQSQEAGEVPDLSTAFGRLAYGLMTTTDPAAVDTLVAQIPPAQMARAATLSPSSGIERLHARLFIMHDTGDPFVPVTESYRLADSVTDPEQKAVAEFELFDHVRPSRALPPWTLAREGIRLMAYLGRLLAGITPDG